MARFGLVTRARGRRSRIATSLLAVPVLAIAGGLLVAIRAESAAVRLVHPPRTTVPPETAREARAQLPGLSDVTFSTADALTLRGWFAAGARRAAVVLVHGWGGNRGQMLREAEALARHGYGVLLYDSRASGESDGRAVTWGDREQLDVVAALDFVCGRPDVDASRIGLVGFSAGASAVALVAARDPRPRAVVLDAMWPSLEQEVAHMFGRYGALSRNAALMGLRRAGVDASRIRPVDAVGAVHPRPLWVLVGEADETTPVASAQVAFRAAREPKSMWTVPRAHHGDIASVAPDEYERRLVAFLDAALDPTPPEPVSPPPRAP